MARFGKTEAPRMTVDELVDGLKRTHGSELRSVVLYGSAASDTQSSPLSDVNVLVLVDTLPVSRLREEAQASRAWVEAGNPPPFTLTMVEWRASADVFPMEYTDILSRHRVLYGDPPFGDMSIRPEDLRLQLEREAVGKLIHLRQGLLQAGGDPLREAQLLVLAFSTYLAIFRGFLRLYGESPAADDAEVVRRAAMLASFDPAPMLRVLEHKRGTKELARNEIAGVVEGYVAGATQLAAHVDTLWRSAEGRASVLGGAGR